MPDCERQTDDKEFYFQLKAQGEWGGWHFPPLYSDRVFAKNKKEAKKKVEEQFDRKLPLRVIYEKREQEPYLLRLTEIGESDLKIKSLFDINTCEECSKEFRVIDNYNDPHEFYKGFDFCSNDCKLAYRSKNRAFVSNSCDPNSPHPTVIYKITNKESGMCYIGKTHQAFTLRWWQHFSSGDDNKFHKAIRDSKYTDWTFEIIEVIESAPEGLNNDEYAFERESYWINEYDSINNGYNSLISRISLNGTINEETEGNK